MYTVLTSAYPPTDTKIMINAAIVIADVINIRGW